MEHFSRTQESEGWSTDLRIVRRSNGTITVQNLKNSGQTQDYESADECAEDFKELLHQQNAS